MLDELVVEYNKLQKKYGDPSLDSITFGGCKKNPDICFVFMNPTARNITSSKEWTGLKAPWIGTKNVWGFFEKIGFIDEEMLNTIKSMKGIEWTVEFADSVYKMIEDRGIYVTNLAKCTQVDARYFDDSVYKKYLKLFMREMEIVNPKVIVLFGNQVSSIVLGEKISVSHVRKKEFLLNKKFKCYPVYYPVGNGIFNMDKAVEDILWIKENN